MVRSAALLQALHALVSSKHKWKGVIVICMKITCKHTHFSEHVALLFQRLLEERACFCVAENNDACAAAQRSAIVLLLH
jgi:hypothetical protein